MFRKGTRTQNFEELIGKINDGETKKLTTHIEGGYKIAIAGERLSQLAAAIRGNKTLKGFEIYNSEHVSGCDDFTLLIDAFSTTHLEYLHLNVCYIGRYGAEKIKNIAELLTPPIKPDTPGVEQPHKVQLKLLNLNANTIDNEGAKYIADALKENQHLEALALSNNHIGDEGCSALAEMLKNNKTIQYINLYWNEIGTKGGVALAGMLEYNTTLKFLILGHNKKIGAEGALAFANALRKNNTLQYIKLSDIGVAAAKELDNAILANKKILYACYDNKSAEVEAELEKRREHTREHVKYLIKKWHRRDHNTFTEYELATFYNNKDSIEFMYRLQCHHYRLLDKSKRDNKKLYKIDFPKFHAELLYRIYARWWVGQALLNGFKKVYENIPPEKNLIKTIVSIWTKTAEITGFNKSSVDDEIEEDEILEEERLKAAAIEAEKNRKAEVERRKKEAEEERQAKEEAQKELEKKRKAEDERKEILRLQKLEEDRKLEAERKRKEEKVLAIISFAEKCVQGVSVVILGAWTFGGAMATLTKMASVSNIANILLPEPVKVVTSIALASVVARQYYKLIESTYPEK